ncbi:MAG TPA: hypothetical protein VKP60_17545 [Magnetospirillaceae bacterium]|nr:hypothetical protein [Magnetospirillaceae bacterium]
MLAGIAIDAAGRQHPLTCTFNAGAFRPGEIFDSANCPPARYLIEIGRRLLEVCPTAEKLVIANPLLPMTAERLAGWIPQLPPGDAPFILSDRASFPLLYILPRRLFDAERFLLLLSACDGVADRRLLSRFAGVEAERVGVSSFDVGDFPISSVTGWFMGRGRQEMLRALALQALETIEARPDDWRSLPFAAYLPYHAGSLLMLNVAARQVSNGLFDKVVACASYRDIVETASGGLEPVWLRLPWLPRDNSVGELDYVIHALKRLGPEIRHSHFFGFLRYSRLYDWTPFHLIDQMKFALGHSMKSEEDTVHGAPPAVRSRAALPPQPLRLLFHLAGGWKLKSYRTDHAAAVFTALRALGCEISVVDQPSLERYGARSVASDSTALLTEAVKAHHIFIAVDSFPHHFVRHVLGWPTIGLFANTKPCNSDAKQGDDYRAVVGALPCNPCGANGRCPVLGAEDCANFARPEQVVSAILTMARTLYGFTETM